MRPWRWRRTAPRFNSPRTRVDGEEMSEGFSAAGLHTLYWRFARSFGWTPRVVDALTLDEVQTLLSDRPPPVARHGDDDKVVDLSGIEALRANRAARRNRR